MDSLFLGKINKLQTLVENAVDGAITDVLNDQIVATYIATKLNAKETEYAPRLTAIEANYRSSPGVGSTAQNTIQGYSGNAVASDLGGCVISGGGQQNGYENVIGGNPDNVGTANSNASPMQTGTYANLSVIGGGYDNVANGLASVIHGYHCKITNPATHGTISGGSFHSITAGDYTVIGGGTHNWLASSYATIAGGANNEATAEGVAIGGGNTNKGSGKYATMPGGTNNTITADYGTIGGGNGHSVSGASGVIGGGTGSTVTQTYGTIGGGLNNAVGGSYASVPGGRDNAANGLYSTAIGRKSLATFEGEYAHAAGMFAAAGDAQASQIILRKQTTDATPAIAGPAGSSTSLNLAVDTTWGFTCYIVARRTDVDGESAMWEVKGLAHRGSGSTTLVGTPSITAIGASAGAAAWALSVTTNGYAIRFNVTGEAGKTINWVGRLNIVQVTG